MDNLNILQVVLIILIFFCILYLIIMNNTPYANSVQPILIDRVIRKPEIDIVIDNDKDCTTQNEMNENE